MAQNVPFSAVVEALLDDEHPFPPRHLHRFSDLEPADLKSVLKVWPRLSPRRKHALLEDLEDLSEADTLTSFDDLARSLLTDEDPYVRMQSIRLLWECEDSRLVSRYLDMLKNDPDVEVRAALASALGPFVYRAELDKLSESLRKNLEDTLLEVARSAGETVVRRRALESLGYSGREEVPALIEAAYHEKNPDWVASALYAMGRSCDERWAKQVLANLRSVNDDVRLEAVQAAGELELESARSILLDLLEDEDDLTIRSATAFALSKIGGPGVRAKLEELVEASDDDEEVEEFEEALDNLTFTEELSSSNFEMFDLEEDDDLHEEEEFDDEDDEA